MTEADDWTGESDDAEIYENSFVPTLFGPWAPWVADAMARPLSSSVLDQKRYVLLYPPYTFNLPNRHLPTCTGLFLHFPETGCL